MHVSTIIPIPTVIILVGIGILYEMHVLFIDIWMTVSDYNTNPTVIILVGIRITEMDFYYWYLDDCIRYNTNKTVIIVKIGIPTSMQLLLIGIWMTVSDYNTNLTVIILVGFGIRNACLIT